MSSASGPTHVPGACHSPARPLAALTLCALALGGCGDVPLRESTVATDLPRITAPIVTGQSDRAAVRKALGEPWLSSARWRFDLFRVSDRATSLALLIVPVWVASDDVHAYVLVAYDERGVVSAHDAGVVLGDDVAGRSILANSQSSSIHLTAGDVSFAVNAAEQVPAVLVSPARRDEYLRQAQRSADHCRVLVGCTNGPCETGIAVDASPPQPLPGSYIGTRRSGPGAGEFWMQAWTAPLAVAPGAHHLAVVPPKMTTLDASTDFVCRAGERLFAAIDLRRAAGMHWKVALEGTVAVTREMPEAFRDQPMVIWRQGTWLVPAEAEP